MKQWDAVASAAWHTPTPHTARIGRHRPHPTCGDDYMDCIPSQGAALKSIFDDFDANFITDASCGHRCSEKLHERHGIIRSTTC
jgi:hypothetical protein